MCGIIACVRPYGAGDAVIEGLRHLEYRGYDSAGVALGHAGGPLVQRAVGPLDELVQLVEPTGWLAEHPAPVAIGHTRWATHGTVTTANAHPFLDCSGRIALVHNGVLDNATSLRAELELAGHRFTSEVDSEVIAHLIEDALEDGIEAIDAVAKALARVEGSWALAIVIGETLLAARQGSPLLVRGGPGNAVLASDAVATSIGSGPLRLLDEGDIVSFGRTWQWRRSDGSSEIPLPVDIEVHHHSGRSAGATPLSRTPAGDGATCADRMSVEISQQPEMAANLIDELLPAALSGQLRRDWQLTPPRRVRFLACGSSFHASSVAARALEELTDAETEVVIASEFDHRARPVDLTVAVSQSGETADLLQALERGSGPIVAITNVAWSSLARRADVVLDCRAGFEQGVAATKSFTAQVIAGVVFALAMVPAAEQRARRVDALVANLRSMPERFAELDAVCRDRMPALVAPYADAPGWLFLGTGAGLPYAAEGALKLKEITYRWAQSYPVGELKHGPLALVERGTPVVLVHSRRNGDKCADRLAASTAEIEARGGQVLHIGGPGSPLPTGPDGNAPWGPLASTIALQHLARELARQLGRNVDRPRNLAKSVTVV
jgi:glucosamine--fructose-6-phosphate aminotransferase (isomerizing)